MSDRFHGCLVQIRGLGVLIGGDSGIGKSETTLELIERGHLFVSDDQVCLIAESGRLKGFAPEPIRDFIEIRGLGILSIPDVFGRESCLAECYVDLVCIIECWEGSGQFDRVGLSRHTREILGMELPAVVLPSKTTASLATLVEIAVRGHINREGGNVSARRLNERLRSRDSAQWN